MITLLKLSLLIIGLVFYFFIYYSLIEKWIITETFWSPLESFFLRHKKIVIYIFLIIGLYRIADRVIGVVANLFYSDLGYSLIEIASYSKFWGLIATIFGRFIRGVLAYKTNLFLTLLTGAILVAGNNLLFAILALSEPNTTLPLFIIVAVNLSGGLASTAFVAFWSNLTMKKFTATQFALFTSLIFFLTKLISGYSASIVDTDTVIFL